MAGAVRYELWVWDSVNEWQQLGGDNLSGTAYTHTGVTAGTTYYYAIRAVNAGGRDERMVAVSDGDVPATVPAA